jgi:predicted porin
MNKKLLITAVGAALVAGSAVATAAPSVYGKFNVGVASVSNGEDSSLAVSDDASRIGVKGDEDLGGGLKAIYMWEVGTRVDSAPATLSSRDAYLGLSDSWGSVRLGQYNSAYKLVSVPLEIFGDTVGDFTHTTFTAGETRTANTIGYTSPNFNGFTVAIERSHKEAADSDTTDPLNEGAAPTAISLTYSMGPLYVAIGQLNGDDASTAFNVGTGSFTTAMGSATKIAARYTMGPFGIWVVQETATAEVTAAGTSGIPAGTEVKGQTQHIGVSFKIGANTTLAATQTTYKDVGDIDDDISSQTAIGLIHNLSKNTAIKVVNTTLSNEDAIANAGRVLSNGGNDLGGPAAGDSVSGTQVQISTSF